MGAIFVPSIASDLDDIPTRTGNGLRSLRVNEAASALEYANDGVDVINVEEARSDIRSTTRAGFSAFDSYAGLQALVDVAGGDTVFYFPANGVFEMGGNLLKTSAQQQSFVSLGRGAELKNGGIEIFTVRCALENLRLTGTSTSGYGIHITDPTQVNWIAGGSIPAETYRHEYSTFLRVRDVEIRDKTWAVYNNSLSGLNRFYELRTLKCTNGVYVNHSDHAGDSGDWHFTECRLTGTNNATGTAMQIVKLGGLTIADTKFQTWSGGLLLEPDTAAAAIATGSPIQGTYLTGSEFEDCGIWDVKITAAAGVASNKYPRWTKIVGGTIHKLLLDKCSAVTLAGVLSDIKLQINAGAVQTEIFGDLNNGISITGAGTDYILIGNNPANGPFIKVGARLTLFDSVNPGGKFL